MMDLKSMLNENSTAASSHNSQSALQQPSRQQTYPPYNRERPPQPPPLQPPEASTQAAAYGSAQSPSHSYSVSSSTYDRGSAHTIPVGYSPGQHPPAGRDGSMYHSQSSTPSGLSAPHPTLQPHQYQAHHRPPTGIPGGSSLSSLVSREGSLPLTGPPPHSSNRQFSPHTSQPSLPGTPLGPPATFQRPSPQSAQRALSYGVEHGRTQSAGSGTHHSYDLTDGPIHHQRTPSRESTVRHYSYEREREKSMSVSPKTIPHPPPIRQTSADQSFAQTNTPPPRLSEQPNRELRGGSSAEAPRDNVTFSSVTPKEQDHIPSPQSSAHQSPRPPTQHNTPISNSTMAPSQPSPLSQRKPVLKRTASAISSSSSSPQPPKKRSKRNELPLYARSARPSNKRPLNYIMKDNNQPAIPISLPVNGYPVNGHVNHAPPRQINAAPSLSLDSAAWEPSITGLTPHEELTRVICDSIFQFIGSAEPPSDGAVFEIEAKLGEIHSIEDGARLRLPVLTETILDKHFGPPTRFQSSMNIDQHRTLNQYLNQLLVDSLTPPRIEMTSAHPRETDSFFSISASGEATLPDSIRRYLNPKHRPRVRITTSTTQEPGEASPTVKIRRIIKSRIADIDVLCPSCAFDYRVSINIESPYEGPDDVLVKVHDAGGGGGEREKDRVSYRHLAYQIDLTQVSYPNSSKKEHELEVEISTGTIREELANLREGRPSRYEDIVRGFLDNVRILGRKASLVRGKGR